MKLFFFYFQANISIQNSMKRAFQYIIPATGFAVLINIPKGFESQVVKYVGKSNQTLLNIGEYYVIP